jgi:YegS/Rv2252/BmrU family lipid kinase
VNYFIINPNAGTNNHKQYLALVKLIKVSPSNVVLETSRPLEAGELVQKAIAEGATRIIAVGGDGTINEVASALIGNSIPLGIIPVGSGNGLARHLGIPLEPNKALQLAITGFAQAIDAGLFNGRPFFCTAGIGFDASVAHRFAKGSGRGLLNYVKATFHTLFQYQPISVSINEGPWEEVFSITFANANQFGNNAYISPYSNIQDGLLEMIKIRKLHLLQAASIGLRLFLGNLPASKSVDSQSVPSIKIQYQSNQPIHLDGEHLFTQTAGLEIKILPKALQVIA